MYVVIVFIKDIDACGRGSRDLVGLSPRNPILNLNPKKPQNPVAEDSKSHESLSHF